MPGQFISAVAKKENNLFCWILSGLITDKEGPKLQNKTFVNSIVNPKDLSPQ